MTNKFAPADLPAEERPAIRLFMVYICEDCLALKGEMCNTPECRFCRRSMAEVGEYLDVLLIRPVIDGERIVGDEGLPAPAEERETPVKEEDR